MKLYQFYNGVQARTRKYPSERYGQAFYNHLCEVRKDLADQIHGTDKDPSNISDSAPGGMAVTIHWVVAHWDDPVASKDNK